MKVLVIHGPNLNLLGKREPEIYGRHSLSDVNRLITDKAHELGIEVRLEQRSSEGEIIDLIHSAVGWAEGIIINPAAYTHYSIAIRDALAAVSIPAVEVHLSNIFAREEFRQHSVISPVAKGVISGLGPWGYIYALEYLYQMHLGE
ncbi:MAG TPA: type II 3-dehydroquinate dehydratase [Firmicutes bacterium]|nr:type II 3-dehydroquinate dehydratase [Bacillota bacterium]